MTKFYSLHKVIFTLLVVVLMMMVTGCSEEKEGAELPQLTSKTVDAATMVLVDAPPVKPPDHIDRWRNSLQENNCLPCHATGSGGATILPDSHYYNNDPTNDVYRWYCIQCHVEQRDDKPAFNRKNE
ncbi:nitrate reductase cytochrome c-type subunit [Evansella vedderi]|uniref:Nitrate reductase cytochrome c-type subunit n=1 Tax=Evansella vedderi TaxID=38282 RepID=A0ABT9ZT31_9BACI|nr:nitrate reductase cytochrome c-type subunit [Evansella vedderi]MDQ0254090.1 nitrate reductase cytochrome c-type subunit [Evansella vedderi]